MRTGGRAAERREAWQEARRLARLECGRGAACAGAEWNSSRAQPRVPKTAALFFGCSCWILHSCCSRFVVLVSAGARTTSHSEKEGHQDDKGQTISSMNFRQHARVFLAKRRNHSPHPLFSSHPPNVSLALCAAAAAPKAKRPHHAPAQPPRPRTCRAPAPLVYAVLDTSPAC